MSNQHYQRFLSHVNYFFVYLTLKCNLQIKNFQFLTAVISAGRSCLIEDPQWTLNDVAKWENENDFFEINSEFYYNSTDIENVICPK